MHPKPKALNAKLTSKGQITIPKLVRDSLELRTGDHVRFIVHDGGRVEMFAATESITKLRGMGPKPRRPVSIEEMDKAIGRSMAKRARRK